VGPSAVGSRAATAAQLRSVEFDAIRFEFAFAVGVALSWLRARRFFLAWRVYGLRHTLLSSVEHARHQLWRMRAIGLVLVLLSCSWADEFARMRALRSQPVCSEAACEAQPEVCPSGTPGLGSSRPASGTQNHSVTFFNTAFRGIALHWLQPNATARPFAEIEPIGRRSVRTYTGDVWQAWASSSSGSKPRLLMEHVVGPAEIRGDCACSDAPLVLCPPRQPGKHDLASRPSYEPAGFINFAGVAVDVYVLGGKSVQGVACETKLASLQPAEQVHFASWAGQTFRCRRAGNQQLLQQHVVGEVHIRDCEPPRRAVHGLPVGSTAEAEAEAGVGAEAGAEAEARGAAACLLKASAAIAEHRRWSRHQVRVHTRTRAHAHLARICCTDFDACVCVRAHCRPRPPLRPLPVCSRVPARATYGVFGQGAAETR
jgi:hypothetical protein